MPFNKNGQWKQPPATWSVPTLQMFDRVADVVHWTMQADGAEAVPGLLTFVDRFMHVSKFTSKQRLDFLRRAGFTKDELQENGVDKLAVQLILCTLGEHP